MQPRFLLAVILATFAALTWAAPPYDITVNFDPPLTGGTPTGYNLYIDDCAASGPAGAAFGTVTSGQTFVAALPVDGSYLVCVRSYIDKPFPTVDVCAGEPAPDPAILICENPDPGPVATIDVADLPVGPVDNLDVTVQCPNGGCTINVTVN